MLKVEYIVLKKDNSQKHLSNGKVLTPEKIIYFIDNSKVSNYDFCCSDCSATIPLRAIKSRDESAH